MNRTARRISSILEIDDDVLAEEDNDYIESMSTTGANSLVLSEHDDDKIEPEEPVGQERSKLERNVVQTRETNETLDFNLTASLSTLISGGNGEGKVPSPPKRKFRSDLNSRLIGVGSNANNTPTLERGTMRLVRERELISSKKHQDSSASSDVEPEVESAKKREYSRRASSPEPAKKWYGNELDLLAVTMAAAGLSVVAGLSFGAGYAVGKRSVK